MNRGWLKLIGNASVEQTRRQTGAPSLAAQRALRREQRKQLRAALRSGPRGLLLTLAVA